MLILLIVSVDDVFHYQRIMENSAKGRPAGLTVVSKMLIKRLLVYLRALLSLHDDTDTESTIDGIRKGVEFKGTNLWILAFAIFIGSIGLNVNSTAVIIGAMLVSPLMGPIMGVGLAVGINDFELLKRSLRNLLVMVVISVIASTLYFLISPLSEARSELLARTEPTIFDVGIALFGGLAGIVAGSRKEKSNAIPGVAIATALMPPLCTAGFGIASGSFTFFAGAFYLFFINSFFIALATYLVVRFLRFPQKEFIDARRERKVKRYIWGFSVVTIVPSIFLAWNLVSETSFQSNAQRFIADNVNFQSSQLVNSKLIFHRDSSTIELTFVGNRIQDDRISDLRSLLPRYGLARTNLVIRQSAGIDDNLVNSLNQSIRQGVLKDLYEKNLEVLESKDQQIKFLEKEVLRLRKAAYPMQQLSRELSIQYPEIEHFSIGEQVDARGETLDTIPTVLITAKGRMGWKREKQLHEWLKIRLEKSNLALIVKR